MRGHRLILSHDTAAKEARLRVIMTAIGIGAFALAIAIAQVKVSLTPTESLTEDVHEARLELQEQSSGNATQMRENASAASAVLQKLLDDAEAPEDTQPVPEPATAPAPDGAGEEPAPTPTTPPSPSGTPAATTATPPAITPGAVHSTSLTPSPKAN